MNTNVWIVIGDEGRNGDVGVFGASLDAREGDERLSNEEAVKRDRRCWYLDDDGKPEKN